MHLSIEVAPGINKNFINGGYYHCYCYYYYYYFINTIIIIIISNTQKEYLFSFVLKIISSINHRIYFLGLSHKAPKARCSKTIEMHCRAGLEARSQKSQWWLLSPVALGELLFLLLLPLALTGIPCSEQYHSNLCFCCQMAFSLRHVFTLSSLCLFLCPNLPEDTSHTGSRHTSS